MADSTTSAPCWISCVCGSDLKDGVADCRSVSIYISVDLEGISGIVHKDQTLPGGKDYNIARKWMTEEVNAAIRGARAAAATFFLINDAHLDMRNLILDDLDDKGDLMVVSGDPKPLGMMQGVDESFSAVFLLGYHAMVGTRTAIVDHSYFSSGTVQAIRLNGAPVGEFTINSAVAGHFGVPVILVSGDDCVCREARGTMPGVQTVCVKTGIARGAGRILTPSRARALIESSAREVVQRILAGDRPEPVALDAPVTLEIDLSYTSMADVAEMVPEVERISGRTVRFTSSDYLDVYKAMQTIITLAMHAK